VINALLTIGGFVAALIGVWLLWGLGAALLIGGVVLFVVGGAGSARENR